VLINVSISDRPLQKAIDQLSRMRPVWRDIGEHLLRRADDGFRYERDPYGARWAPLAASTLAQKRRQKRIMKILQSRGLMRGTLAYQAYENRVVIGFNAFYAAFHQSGTKKMPKRQLLPDAGRGLPSRDVNAIFEIVQDHLK
jgi:phage virion morphogenesis protein